MSAAKVCTCRFCGDQFTPQGHTNHERWCEDNDNAGMTYEQQQELGVLTEGASPAGNPDPDQRDGNNDSGGLPPLNTLTGDNEPTGGGNGAVTDGGEPDDCPRCGSADVLEAGEAKREYIDRVEKPHPRAVLAYELAAWTCCEPECAACWGDEYHEPIPMEAILDA